MKKKAKYFIEHFFFLLMTYAIMFERHYASDSYFYSANFLTYGDGNIALGRVGAYFVSKIGRMLHLDCVEEQIWMVLLLIISFALSATLIWCEYKKYYKESRFEQDVIVRLSIIILYCNVFVLEWFVFLEMDITWSLSILLMTLAVAKVNTKITLKNTIVIFVLETVSLTFYQGTLGYFITFGLLLCLIMSKGELKRTNVLNYIRVTFVGVLASATNIIIIRIAQEINPSSVTNRTKSLSLMQVIENIKKVLLTSWQWLVNANGLLPKNSTLIIFCITYMVFVIWNVVYIKNIKRTILYTLIIIISFGSVIGPHIMTSSLWMAQRTIVAFLAIITIPWAIISLESETTNFLYKVGVVVLTILLMINIIKIQCISANVIAKNRIDAEIAYSVQKMIEKYQEETGNVIRNICVLPDANVSRGYRSTDYNGIYDTNKRAFVISWSSVNVINYYNGTNYTQVEADEELLSGLLNKDWNYLDLSEQMIYNGDTVYIFAY